MKVSRSYTWPMGHRLARHQGRCRWVHGHNWVAEVTVADRDGEPMLWGDDRPDCGMVMDFYDVDNVIKPIIDQWDHGFMVEEQDPFLGVLAQFDEVSPTRIIVVPFAPTSENIAAHLAQEVREAMRERKLVSVRVSESARSWAEWTEEDQ